MAPIQIFMVWGALSGALFPSFSYAGEWENFQDLKAALVRSEKGARSRQIPPWLNPLPLEPRPHYWLDDRQTLPVKVAQETPQHAPPSSSPPTTAAR